MRNTVRLGFILLLLGSLVAASAFLYQGTGSFSRLRSGGVEPGGVWTVTTYMLSQPYDITFGFEDNFTGSVALYEYAAYFRFVETGEDDPVFVASLRGPQTVSVYPARRGAYVLLVESSSPTASTFDVTWVRTKSLHADVFFEGAVISAFGAGSFVALYSYGRLAGRLSRQRRGGRTKGRRRRARTR